MLEAAEVVTVPESQYQNGAVSPAADTESAELAGDVTTERPETETVKKRWDGGNTEAFKDRAGGTGFRPGLREPPPSSSVAPQQSMPALERPPSMAPPPPLVAPNPPSMAPPPVRPIPAPSRLEGNETKMFRKERKKAQDMAEGGAENRSPNQADEGSTNGRPRSRAPGSGGQRQRGQQQQGAQKDWVRLPPVPGVPGTVRKSTFGR